MKILIIQTAFLGDVILATSLIEKLAQHYSNAQIDFLLRKGNEQVLNKHPRITQLHVFDKTKGKISNILQIIKSVRNEKYDIVINVHRFGSSGMIAGFSGAKEIIGFAKNPFSFLYSKKVAHAIGNGMHEVERNQLLISHLTDSNYALPKLYPTDANNDDVSSYKTKPYICIAPGSIWYTKQFPAEKWISLIKMIPEKYSVYLLGAPADKNLCMEIKTNSERTNLIDLSGKLHLLSTASLMKDAFRNFTNDSAPLHICSAMNAPVSAVFCSTIPSFGFGPLSTDSKIIEIAESLACRPCGLHGFKSCPQGHFKCAFDIDLSTMKISD